MRITRSALLAFVVGVGITASTAAAYDAINADKVDGKHAVGAGAGVNARKGKLVATAKSTGRLPNDIIKRRPTRPVSAASPPRSPMA